MPGRMIPAILRKLRPGADRRRSSKTPDRDAGRRAEKKAEEKREAKRAERRRSMKLAEATAMRKIQLRSGGFFTKRLTARRRARVVASMTSAERCAAYRRGWISRAALTTKDVKAATEHGWPIERCGRPGPRREVRAMRRAASGG